MKDFLLDIREVLAKAEDVLTFALAGEVDLPEDCQVEGDVTLSGICRNIGGSMFLLEGKLSYVAKGICARCLMSASAAVEADFAERFARNPEDEDIFSFTGDTLDLSEAVRQAVLLEYPEKLLCKADCKGICPVCGQILNERDCGCTAMGSDLEED
ncbi:MAG: DUF177 domain-containing protein [Clostridiales bacterium]|nr:DUF177 domain-containing protein [Clostridiales bacterium]